ncbi:hypothetical protein I4U23_028903 [Adineta vaga]|nr:hypothetical protein I4U23_028903 [Adineta vaga]
MRLVPILLVLILFKVEQTMSNADCKCECCTTQYCNPTLIGTHSLWFCSETTSCTKNDCINWHPTLCPRDNVSGQTRAVCASNAHRTLSTLCIILSMFSLIHLLI